MGLDYEARGVTLRERVDQMRNLWSRDALQRPQGSVTVRPYLRVCEAGSARLSCKNPIQTRFDEKCHCEAHRNGNR